MHSTIRPRCAGLIQASQSLNQPLPAGMTGIHASHPHMAPGCKCQKLRVDHWGRCRKAVVKGLHLVGLCVLLAGVWKSGINLVVCLWPLFSNRALQKCLCHLHPNLQTLFLGGGHQPSNQTQNLQEKLSRSLSREIALTHPAALSFLRSKVLPEPLIP